MEPEPRTETGEPKPGLNDSVANLSEENFGLKAHIAELEAEIERLKTHIAELEAARETAKPKRKGTRKPPNDESALKQVEDVLNAGPGKLGKARGLAG